MRLLKAFVIGMGVLIVVGGGVIAWGLVRQWNQHGPGGGATAVTSLAAPAAEQAYASVDVPAPEGMKFVQMTTTADRVLLHFSGPDGERIVMVDPRTGRVTGTISVAPSGK